MERHAHRFEVNCSLLFTELPVFERPAAAKAAGFDAVEFWWPFAEPVPAEAEVDRFVSALDEAGVRLVGLNFFAGDMPGGDRGLVSWPGREQEFRDNAAVVAAIGERTGCRAFNALYGNRIDGVDPATQDELALENLQHAAKSVAAIDGTVLVEPVSGSPRYPLLTAEDAIRVIDAVRSRGATNLALLADLYHLRVNGDDIDHVIATHADRIGHVQIADAPGRNEPGTGEIDFEYYFARLDDHGYTGWIGLEYKPSGASSDSFAWLR
ncbi:TIM barrel protein [Haloechinothrix sp. LS1_15]|uniref:hydroxypyruvate isomerase family protein n=1 Tax=Haloechinothrix sp. LS1_15 TaxID=2652248 RepID=UPI002944FF8C|nr:TIM barrel protein [Haloechinothrix sp. LS1_15]MDV6012831.1 TIM barrel protein [Haloechinothrix sp. LS1_15]